MIKALFYDFDGVIKDSTDIKADAFYELYLPYGADIAQQVLKHHTENGGMSRFEKFQYYHANFLNIVLTDNQVQELANRFSELVLKKVIESPYVAGAYEAIIQGSQRYKQFIVTGTPQAEIEYILEQMQVKNYFVGIGGSPRNKIEISKEFLQNYQLKAKEVLFIGDATTDYKCAQHFGFYFYLREHSENKELFKDYPVFKWNDLSKLDWYINQLNQSNEFI